MGGELVGSIRRVRRFIEWASAGAALLLGTLPAAVQVCACPAFDLAAVVAQADVIFVGKSLSATNDSSGMMRNDADDGGLPGVDLQTRLLFDVATVLKGDPPRFVEVVTSTGACGFRFAVSETYLVVGKRQGAAVSTDRCQGNVKGLDTIDERVESIRDALDHPPRRVPPASPSPPSR